MTKYIKISRIFYSINNICRELRKLSLVAKIQLTDQIFLYSIEKDTYTVHIKRNVETGQQ